MVVGAGTFEQITNLFVHLLFYFIMKIVQVVHTEERRRRKNKQTNKQTNEQT